MDLGHLEENAQLLEIAVGNVMAAPVRNSIKLDAVGELHLVLLLEPLPFLLVLVQSSTVRAVGVFACSSGGVVAKLVGVADVRDYLGRTPSSVTMAD